MIVPFFQVFFLFHFIVFQLDFNLNRQGKKLTNQKKRERKKESPYIWLYYVNSSENQSTDWQAHGDGDAVNLWIAGTTAEAAEYASSSPLLSKNILHDDNGHHHYHLWWLKTIKKKLFFLMVGLFRILNFLFLFLFSVLFSKYRNTSWNDFFFSQTNSIEFSMIPDDVNVWNENKKKSNQTKKKRIKIIKHFFSDFHLLKIG